MRTWKAGWVVLFAVMIVAMPTEGRGETKGMGVFVWPGKARDAVAAKQIEGLTDAVLAKHGETERARYFPVMVQEMEAQAFQRALKAAQVFLKEDLKGRHNRTLMNHSMTAYLKMTPVLASASLEDIADVYRILTVSTFRDGQAEMASQYISGYRHFSEHPTLLEEVATDVFDFAQERSDEAAVAVPGTLQVQSKPSGASVRVDGKGVGVTPLKVSVAPGLHHVLVSFVGHYPIAKMIEVVTEDERNQGDGEVTMTLRPHPGYARYRKAIAQLRKRIAAGKGKSTGSSASEILRLMDASGLLVIVVSDKKKKGFSIRGIYAAPDGTLRPFQSILSRDARLLSSFEQLLLESMGKAVPTSE